MAPVRLVRYWMTLALIFTIAAAEPPAADHGNSTAGALASPHHKSLMPLNGADIGLFMVIFVALFIASGAGVGGGTCLAANNPWPAQSAHAQDGDPVCCASVLQVCWWCLP